MNTRIYKYDNVKAFLILLVVIGHMTTDYVSDSFMVRWITLWIYSFHMPAFIFVSGLVHKQYITEERAALGVRGETRLRSDKALGFFLCGYGLKLFLQFTRTLMGQHPLWHTIAEPGIPWYLFVMAEYELLFYVMRHIDGGGTIVGRQGITEQSKGLRPWMLIAIAFAMSAAVGYIPAINDTFCLSRMINFLPIYALGYYLDMKKFLAWIENGSHRILMKAGAWTVIVGTLMLCRFGRWGLYSWRKWFTGRRTYEFLTEYFTYAVRSGWWIRIAVWLFAIVLTLAIIIVIPDREYGFITTAGSRTLNVYFWHRPVCYLFRNWKVLPRLAVMFGATYDQTVAGQIPGHAFGGSSLSMACALAVYFLIGIAMTAFFSLKIFEHPTADLMKLGALITGRNRSKRVN